jgi:crossover junction endodeoxyribonuclease RuvC
VGGGALHIRATAAVAPEELVIFGVDPGLRVTGYGAVLCAGQKTTLIGFGVSRTDPASPVEERLLQLRDDLSEAMQRLGAAELAMETPFVGQNVRSALTLGEARGAALIAAGEARVPVYHYAPADVKRSVAGYGRGEKDQVARAVVMQLGLATTPTPTDASDALAIALCHFANRRARLLAGTRR